MDELSSLVRGWYRLHGPHGAGLRLGALISVAWTVIGLSLILVGHALEVLLAAATASGLATVIAVLGGLLVAGSVVALVTVPLVGWQLGRWAADARTNLGPALGLACVVVLAGDAVVSSVIAAVAVVVSGPGSVLIGLYAFAVGLITLGLPGLGLAFPSAYAWVRLLRSASAAEKEGLLAAQPT